MDAPSPLHIEVHGDAQVIVAAPIGELDVLSSAHLADLLERAMLSGVQMVIVDLRELEFMDSTGLRVLIKSHQAAQDLGVRFAIVKGSQQVERLLSITHLEEQFTLLDAPEDLIRRELSLLSDSDLPKRL